MPRRNQVKGFKASPVERKRFPKARQRVSARSAKPSRRGIFISFEGGEGSGKTTQVRLLLQRMQQAGQSVVMVKEPGSTPLGDRLRELLKGRVAMTLRAELLLFIAARAELVATVIQPALDRGVHVIADRYADSTVAYQGYGRRMSRKRIEQLNLLATGGLRPDVTFLLDIAAQQGLGRTRPQTTLDAALTGASGTRGAEEGQERFEGRSLAFHLRVLAGYRKMAAAEPERWCVLDATRAPETIGAQAWDRVLPLIGRA